MNTKLVIVALVLTILLVEGVRGEAKNKKGKEKDKKKDVKKEEKKKEEEEKLDVEEFFASGSGDYEYVEEEDDMTVCLKQENVTESVMKDFLVKKVSQENNEPLKKAILCFVKKIDFFDGKKWKMKVIRNSLEDNPKMVEALKKCIKTEDKSLAAHERAYRVQKCVLDTNIPMLKN